MTSPVISPIPNPTDDQELYWEQQRQRRQAAMQAADQSTQISPDANRINAPQNYNNQIDIANKIGAAANAGVAGSIATQQQQQAEQRQKEFQAQQKAALDELRTQVGNYQMQMNSQYQQLLNQRFNQADQTLANWQGQNRLSGSNYTGQAAQIAQYARQAGFPESAIPTAVAIAMAESSGRADATHSNTNGSIDRGLMQINSIHSQLLSQYNWKDPLQNMQMAYQIWKDAGNSWTPWSTFNNGAYQQFTGIGQQAWNAAQSQYPIQPAALQPYQANTQMGLRTALVDTAQQYIGLPYVWGGENLSKGVDCSGLVQAVYKKLGINLPRTADEQSHVGTRTSISNLQAGDLVAWQGGWRGPNYVGHIAIYKGNGQIIEAPYEGASVRVRNLRPDENVFGVHLTIKPR